MFKFANLVRPRVLLGVSASGLLAVAIAWAADPGTPLGADEVRVNTTTALAQTAPALARDGDGDAVVVWASASVTDNGDIFMQRYLANGALSGAETRVNNTATGVQGNPAVAMDALGNYVVVWESDAQDGSGKGVFAQRYSATGAAQGSEFRVNTTTTNNQELPAVAMGAAGDFVVAWQSLSQDGSGQGVYAQRYGASGAAQGTEFQVNVTTTSSQRDAAVALDAAGNFAIAWQSNAQDGDLNGIFMRRYDASGLALAGEQAVNTITAGDQSKPSIALSGTGLAVVTWMGPDAVSTGIYARRFDNTGTALDVADVAINTTTDNAQQTPAVAADANGDYAISWTSTAQDGAGLGIVSRRYNALGVAQSAETVVNTVTANDQSLPAVAADADGDFAIAWQSSGVADAGDIILRRFTGPEAVDLSLTKTDSPDPVTTAAALTYTISVRNLHAASTTTGVSAVDGAIGAATGVVVVDTLPTGVNFLSASGTNWTCTNSSGTITCTLAGALNATASSTITLNTTAPTTAPASRSITNTATVTANQFDDAASNNTGTADTAVCGLGENPGTFAVVAVTTANEAAANADVQVTRSGGTCGPVTLNFATSDGTATAGTDYTTATGTLSWANGDATAKTLQVPVLADALDEDNETVRVTISNASRGTIGTPTANLTITDDDASPSVAFLVATSGAGEAAGSARVTVQLSAVSGRDVTVPFTLSGTATNGTATSDYTTNASPLTITAGQRTADVVVTVVDDTRDEDDETVILTLGAATNATAGATTAHTLTLSDNDDPPTVTFGAASSAATEGTTTTLVIPVNLSAASGKTVTAPFSFTGSAAAGSDFSASASPLTFNPGQTSQSITLTINNDTLDEADETAVITLDAPTNATLGAQPTHTVGFVDNDAAPTVNFSTASQSVGENTATATITVSLSAVSGQNVTVPYSLSGTATDVTDYSAAPASPLVITAGQMSATVTVTVVNDSLDENDETVIATLGTPTNATLGATTTHTLTLTDDDASPTIGFTAPSQSAAENVSGGVATVVAQLSAVSGRAVLVNYTLSGTATSGTDYSAAPAATLTIPAGSDRATLTFSITDDADREADETAIATLATTATNATVDPATRVHTLTIEDNDLIPQVSFAAAAQTIAESGGTATIAVRLSRAADADVTVDYERFGTAINTTDYSISPARLIIPEGEMSGTLTLTVVNDRRAESSETVVLEITAASNAQVRTTPREQHTVTITDDDTAGVTRTESGASTNVIEAGATDSYTLVLTSEPSTSVSVSVASASSQVTPSPATLTFTAANWDVPQTVTVTAVDDVVAEGAHSDTLRHTVTSSDLRYSGVAVPDVTVSITDNDVRGVMVTESAGVTSVTEAGATDSYTLSLATQPTADVTITLMPDTTQVGASPTSLTFTTANWNTPQTVTVTAVNDEVAEANPHGALVMHRVASSDAGYNAIAVRDVTVSITDNDSAGIVLSKTTAAVTEGGATDAYTIRLASQPAGDVTVALSGGSQLGANPASLTFTAVNWNLARTVTVSAVNDSDQEGSHTATLSHTVSSSDTRYNAIAVTNVTVTITDDDAASSGFTGNGGGGGGSFDWMMLVGLLGLWAARRRVA